MMNICSTEIFTEGLKRTEDEQTLCQWQFTRTVQRSEHRGCLVAAGTVSAARAVRAEHRQRASGCDGEGLGPCTSHFGQTTKCNVSPLAGELPFSSSIS